MVKYEHFAVQQFSQLKGRAVFCDYQKWDPTGLLAWFEDSHSRQLGQYDPIFYNHKRPRALLVDLLNGEVLTFTISFIINKLKTHLGIILKERERRESEGGSDRHHFLTGGT
jgi:hypothetical protein